MSNGLNAGGAPMQMVRDLGTPGAVQGFRAAEITQGPRLAAALAFNYLVQAASRAAQTAQSVAPSATKFWIKVSGVWKEAVAHLKVSGVWKVATPAIKVSGVWK